MKYALCESCPQNSEGGERIFDFGLPPFAFLGTESGNRKLQIDNIMMFRGHVTVGVFTYLIAVIPVVAWILFRVNWETSELWQYWWEIAICFVLCVIGAMIPDVDIKSKSQRVVYSFLILIELVLILLMYYEIAAVIGFFAMIPNILKHRGPTHSRLAAIIVPLPLLIIPALVASKLSGQRFDYRHIQYQQLGVSYYIATVFGYVSHLVADRKGRK